MEDEHVKALASALSRNFDLLDLDLRRNSISEVGVIALIRAVTSNCSSVLSQLLFDVIVSDAHMDEVALLMEKETVITNLGLNCTSGAKHPSARLRVRTDGTANQPTCFIRLPSLTACARARDKTHMRKE